MGGIGDFQCCSRQGDGSSLRQCRTERDEDKPDRRHNAKFHHQGLRHELSQGARTFRPIARATSTPTRPSRYLQVGESLGCRSPSGRTSDPRRVHEPKAATETADGDRKEIGLLRCQRTSLPIPVAPTVNKANGNRQHREDAKAPRTLPAAPRHVSVEQEVGGSSPPNCTSLKVLDNLAFSTSKSARKSGLTSFRGNNGATPARRPKAAAEGLPNPWRDNVDGRDSSLLTAR